MTLRAPVMLASAFLCFAIAYTAVFTGFIYTDARGAENRFHLLSKLGAPGKAASHGERAIRLYEAEEVAPATLPELKSLVASAQFKRRNFERTAALLREALRSEWSETLDTQSAAQLENKLALSYLYNDELGKAAAIYASFLDLAGDAIAHPAHFQGEQRIYAHTLIEAGPVFETIISHTAPHEIDEGAIEHTLAVTNHLAALGGFYAMRKGQEYAAAGLLATAYEARKNELGADHRDTVQLTLMLGPLYARMGRFEDAERLYLDAFHAQEKVKGPNSPDLSLYIKLLAGVYENQGRITEAQALYEHMRGLFQDAFGAQRYSANRAVDRREYINRPVSQYFPLNAEYKPTDLVAASKFFVPTSKGPNSDEMKLRLAADIGADAREANLPARLAQLISLCRSESGESVSLRSGYRSFFTQSILYENNGDRGTVTPPGVSEHQTGLAADINVDGRFMRQSDRAYQCFEENAFRFGFILSYPPGNDYLPGDDSFEPWHWRYVGVQTAQLYREAGPLNKPQEFLSALPCYQERAAAGEFPTAGEPDICLEASRVKTAENDSADSEDAAFDEAGGSARILNSNAKSALSGR